MVVTFKECSRAMLSHPCLYTEKSSPVVIWRNEIILAGGGDEIYLCGGGVGIHLFTLFWRNISGHHPSQAMSEVQSWIPKNFHRWPGRRDSQHLRYEFILGCVTRGPLLGEGHNGAGWIDHRGGFLEAASVDLSLEE